MGRGCETHTIRRAGFTRVLGRVSRDAAGRDSRQGRRRGEAKEWIEHDDGRTECTAFVPLGAAQPQRAVSDPKHTFSVEDDGSVRIEIPSGVGVDVDARGTATSRIIAAALRQLIAENAAILAANRDCLTHFEDMLQEYTGMAHFVADLRAVFSLNECGFTELMNAAIEANEDAVRLDWLCTLTQQRLTRIRAAFVRRGPGAAVLDSDAGDIRAAIDVAMGGENG